MGGEGSKAIVDVQNFGLGNLSCSFVGVKSGTGLFELGVKDGVFAFLDAVLFFKFLLAKPRDISRSAAAASAFFLPRAASDLALASTSKLACMDSMAREWFFLTVSNSSSFSESFLSMSALT